MRKKEMIRTRHDYFYLQMVGSYGINFKRAVESVKSDGIKGSLKEFTSNLKASGISNIKELDELFEKYNFGGFSSSLFAAKAYGNIIIVFSALCLEALINDYCVTKKSGTYFKKQIEKLDTLSKWIIAPKLITNKEISHDSQCIELLKELFKARNDLVHPKSKEHGESLKEQILSKEVKDFLFRQVPHSILAIKAAASELHNIDPTFEYLDDYKGLWGESERAKERSEIIKFYSSVFGLNQKAT